MTCRFFSPAQQDAADAVAYYDEAVPGVGLEFLDELEHTLHRILLHPKAWTPLSQEHQRCRMRRFPYGVIYSVEEDAVLTAAVFHFHRHPDSWRRRT